FPPIALPFFLSFLPMLVPHRAGLLLSLLALRVPQLFAPPSAGRVRVSLSSRFLLRPFSSHFKFEIPLTLTFPSSPPPTHPPPLQSRGALSPPPQSLSLPSSFSRLSPSRSSPPPPFRAPRNKPCLLNRPN